MDKTIVTALLVMAGVISAVLVFNSIYPAIGQTSDALTMMQGRLDNQLKSQIQIIHAASSDTAVLLWVKNLGSLRVSAVNACDLFFGPEGNFSRIPFWDGTGQAPPQYWTYSVEGRVDWDPSSTLKITITGLSPLPAGNYYAKFSLPNGVASEDFFSW